MDDELSKILKDVSIISKFPDEKEVIIAAGAILRVNKI